MNKAINPIKTHNAVVVGTPHVPATKVKPKKIKPTTTRGNK